MRVYTGISWPPNTTIMINYICFTNEVLGVVPKFQTKTQVCPLCVLKVLCRFTTRPVPMLPDQVFDGCSHQTAQEGASQVGPTTRLTRAYGTKIYLYLDGLMHKHNCRRPFLCQFLGTDVYVFSHGSGSKVSLVSIQNMNNQHGMLIYNMFGMLVAIEVVNCIP